LRVRKDADLLAGKLKAKGYPALVDAGGGDGWIRVIVGPFSGVAAAKEYRTKLRGDGFDTMLRKR
jgi:cell division protein FtsN